MAQAFNLLTTFGPWVTLFTVLFIVAYIGVTFFVRTKMKHIDDKFSDITKSFEKVNLRFDKLEDKFETVSSNINGAINALSGEFREFKGFSSGLRHAASQSETITHQLSEPSTKATSPLTLTEKGDNIALSINADALADKYFTKVNVPDDAHKLVVQDTCTNFVLVGPFMQIINNEERIKLWDTVYDEGGNTNDVLFVIAVKLKDRIFRERNIEIPVRSNEKTSDTTVHRTN